MKVYVEMIGNSKIMEYTDIADTYVKGGMYCLRQTELIVTRIPMANIYRVTEDHT